MHRLAASPIVLVALALLAPSPRLLLAAEVVAEQRILDPAADDEDRFGEAVAADDRWLVVGARWAEGGGAVHLFERTGDGPEPWEHAAVLTGAGGDFGSAVALQGKRIVVGAQDAEDTGIAHVFELDGSGSWEEVARLRPPAVADRFGNAVALDGDTVVVGADLSDDWTGRAYVFERDAGGPGAWGPVAELLHSDAGPDDFFGVSVALDGDLAAVGAEEANERRGAVYLFERDAGGSDAWGEVDRITAGDADFLDLFGNAIALDGDAMVVGARFRDGGIGGVYFFERLGDGSWLEVSAVDGTLLTLYGDAGFGYSVALEGDLAIVAMPEIADIWDAPQQETHRSGQAFVFHRDAGGSGEWGMVAGISNPGAGVDEDFAVAVALDGDTLFAGALGDEATPPFTGLGSVYVSRANDLLLGAAGECPGEVTMTLSGATPGGPVLLVAGREEGELELPADACAGSVVEIADPRPLGLAPAGPDGVLAVSFAAATGTCDALAQAVDLASCRVSTLAAVPPPPLPPWIAKVQAPDTGYLDWFGSAVAADASTLVVGARYAEAPGSSSGSADVFAPDPEDPVRWRHVADLTVPGIAPHDELGFDVAIDGDVAVASANGADPLGQSSGAAYVFERVTEEEWRLTGELLPADGGAEERFGSGVAVSGETVAVGAHFHDHGGSGDGAVYVFERDPADPDGWLQIAELLPPEDETHWLGGSVALDGDRMAVGASGSDSVVIYERPPDDPAGWAAVAVFDADDGQLGLDVDLEGDVAVAGAPSADVAGEFSGTALVYERGGDGAWTEVQALEPSGHDVEDYFGGAVAVAGELIAVGSDQDAKEPDAGAVHLFQRQEGGEWIEVARLLAPDAGTGHELGSAVAVAGPYVFAGARGDDDPGDLAGSAYVLPLP